MRAFRRRILVFTVPGGIAVLTGAGISAESGLRTFRAADGLWEEHRIEDVATPEGFARDPHLVHRFYNARRRAAQNAAPNAAHIALAEFERRHDGDFLLITQNIDDLHERAGSRNIVHMHGELFKMRCESCGGVFAVRGDLSPDSVCGECGAAGRLRPDIVWFGEMPYEMARIGDALAQCALFVSVGTSGNVYPAAGFVLQARAAKAECVELNLEPSAGNARFDRALYGPATKIVDAFFGERAAAGR